MKYSLASWQHHPEYELALIEKGRTPYPPDNCLEITDFHFLSGQL